MKIVLIGNPNVGKSAFFSRLTGVDVVISNYPGTTVEFTSGKMLFDGNLVEVIDAPGVYHLKPSSKAEEVTAKIIEEGDLIINVIDATNLERNLFLTFQLLEKNIPVIMALNFWDETKHKGINIDVEKLAKELEIPVVPTVSITAQGVRELVLKLKDAKAHSLRYSKDQKWAKIGNIVEETQHIEPKNHTFLERLEDLSIKPLTGLPIALGVLVFTFWIVRFIGEGLSNAIGRLFNFYLPVVTALGDFLGPGILRDILVGSGENLAFNSMGVLTTGLFVPIAMILPYIFAFYLVLGFLEDSGYLPRLATLLDNVMHKFGMHGMAIIPMLLGLGCNVPGVCATRILETKKQRFVAATLMTIAVPCMNQLAMVFGLLGKYGVRGLSIFFVTLFIVWCTLGFLLRKLVRGTAPEIFLEIPPYRIPFVRGIIKKTCIRVKGFLLNAIPFVILGVFVANILYISGILHFVGDMMSPIIVKAFGLPKEATVPLVIGLFRKDVAIGTLMPLQLTMKQLVIANVVLTMYFPCFATFVVLFKEIGFFGIIKATAIMLTSTALVGSILNLVL